ncbi:MAG: phosphatidylserine decarboxylase family protein [Bacteroidales bacterium]|nr:phosphatidylserine decarboxylase family protein [Bacteroidales bacterium]MDD4670407.1 phosphatidylserine decarboxylase family protein [Bacteroidales bacterium]
MKIHKEGYTIIIVNAVICAVIAAAVIIISDSMLAKWIVSAICLFLALFMLTFFRVPTRNCRIDESLVISPGDGKVVKVKEVVENEYFHGKCIRVSIFLTFFNVHVTWFPVGGIVSYYKYHPGKYIFAWHHKSSEKNERTTIVVKNDNGQEILFRQIAGIVARRVVCYAEEGVRFGQTDQAGFIKFGSRLDVFLPLGTEILVKRGDKVKGQETPIAKL